MTYYLPPLTPPTYVVVVGLVSGLFVMLGLISKRFTKGPAVERVGKALFQVGWLGTLVFFCGALFSSGITFLYFYLPALFDSAWAALAAFVIGIGLFVLRKRQLAIYAGLEIGGAFLTIAVCALTQYGSSYQRAIALMTAIYFLIRGLDNADKGDLYSKLKVHFKRMKRREKFVAFIMGIGLIIGTGTSIYSEILVAPPYMSSPRGVFPVSVMECGGLFIVCDEKAWREHKRLQTGTIEDRRQAVRIAEARQRSLQD